MHVNPELRRFPWSVADALEAAGRHAAPAGNDAASGAALCAALTACLASPAPMLLLWGDARLCFYNAACLDLLRADHPGLWGRPLAEASAELQASLETPAGWRTTAIGDTQAVLGHVATPAAAPAPAPVPSMEHLLTSVFEQSPAFLAVLKGPDHVVETANRRFLHVLGDRPVLGLPLREAAPELVEQGFIDLLDSVRESRQPFIGESMVAAIRRPGEAEPYEARVDFVYQPMLDPSGAVEAVLVHGIDVTQQFRSEARDGFLLSLEDELHGLSEPQQIIDTSVRLLAEHLCADRCAYGTIGTDGRTMRVVSDHVQGIPRIQGKFRLDEVAHRLLERLQQNRPWMVNDIQAFSRRSFIAAPYRDSGLRASLVVPLHKHGQLVAVMGVHQCSPRRWTSSEIELVRRVLTRCWESLQRSRAQRRMAASEAHLRRLADTLPQIVFVTSEDGTPQYFNRRWYEYTGVDPATGAVDGWKQAHTPMGLLQSDAAWMLALNGTRAYEVECELRAADGGLRWHLARALPVHNESGVVIQWIGTYTDIHDRRDFEQKLAESETRFRNLCETVPTMIWMSDAEGDCMYWSPQWYDFTGQCPEEAIPQGWWTAVHPDDAARVRHAFEQALQQRLPFSSEYRVRRSDGRYRWCVDTASPHFGVDGEFLGHIGAVTDITERKHVEDETASERSILNLITTGTALPLVLDAIALNVESRSESELRCAIMLADHERGQLRHASAPHMPLDYSLHFDRLPIRPGGIPCGRAAWGGHQVICDDIADDSSWAGYQAVALSMGIAACFITPVIGSNGLVLGTLNMYYSLPHVPSLHEQAMARSASYLAGIVIERNRMDAQLQQSLESEKNARALAEHANRAKDEFLATLSHELRTPLNAILGWSRLMQSDGFSTDNLGKGLMIIERSAQSQAQIIDDLLDMSAILSGKVRLQPEHFDMAGLVRSTVELLRPNALAKRIELQAVGAEDGPVPFFGDPGRMQQVLTNLIGNALKFTAAEGTVTVAVEQGDDALNLSVQDSGIGIAEDFLPHVFDRFRQADAGTTRRVGGLGLGLSISRQLVDLHGGSLSARSPGPGCGSTFIVALPLHHGASGPPEPAPAPAPPRGGALPEGIQGRLDGLHVLLVDDEDDSREVTRQFLLRAGAAVECAPSADEAERRLLESRYDVLVSDIAMPERDGYDLIRNLRGCGRAIASLPAIALTAYVRDEDRDQALLAGFDAHIGKPLDPLGLVELIEILAMRPRPADALASAV
ncbi:PAS domain S-box protein [[Pseudomonas] boreopolis]|uniref:histidine kinase n=1 Tax=Xanthomonas boreopolis TaxID=86183 RepID=A0A919F4J6_9XANT|nr:histidine kinase [[Pseudomonas] boreopolis]